MRKAELEALEQSVQDLRKINKEHEQLVKPFFK